MPQVLVARVGPLLIKSIQDLPWKVLEHAAELPLASPPTHLPLKPTLSLPLFSETWSREPICLSEGNTLSLQGWGDGAGRGPLLGLMLPAIP